jgi:DNA invertase Pin-like site-specific DNA recombinase
MARASSRRLRHGRPQGRKVYRAIVSGAKTDRAPLRQGLARLTAGDVLLGTRLDRLARSTRDLRNTLAVMTGRGVGGTSLGDAWADTTTGVSSCVLSDVGKREAGQASGIALGRRMPSRASGVP